ASSELRTAVAMCCFHSIVWIFDPTLAVNDELVVITSRGRRLNFSRPQSQCIPPENIRQRIPTVEITCQGYSLGLIIVVHKNEMPVLNSRRLTSDHIQQVTLLLCRLDSAPSVYHAITLPDCGGI